MHRTSLQNGTSRGRNGANTLTRLAAACAIAAAFATPPVAAREEVAWHARPERAREAAAKSGKLVYLYIFTPAQKACNRMRAETLTHPTVIELLRNFECCPVDASVAANKAIVDKYAWGVSEDRELKTRFGSMPAHLFTDAAGKEHYIRWGFIPAPGFVVILRHVLSLAELKAVLAKTPKDPRANADLGHVMIELELFDKGKEHLRLALANDPDNKAGALEDATLDLTILSIPDDPVKGFAALGKFLEDFPRTDRKLEVVYFQAAALAAQGTPAKYREAVKLLQPFKTADETQPAYNSPWTLPALELDSQLRAALGMR